MTDLELEIKQVRRDKEAAIEAEDYEIAAGLRDKERQLLAMKATRQQEWAAANLDLPSLADRLHRLSDEVERLRRLLGQQDSGPPQDGAA